MLSITMMFRTGLRHVVSTSPVVGHNRRTELSWQRIVTRGLWCGCEHDCIRRILESVLECKRTINCPFIMEKFHRENCRFWNRKLLDIKKAKIPRKNRVQFSNLPNLNPSNFTTFYYGIELCPLSNCVQLDNGVLRLQTKYTTKRSNEEKIAKISTHECKRMVMDSYLYIKLWKFTTNHCIWSPDSSDHTRIVWSRLALMNCGPKG